MHPLCLFHHISSLFLFLPAPNPCATSDGKGPCSHLCLINFNQTFSCACPHLMKLQPDERNCKGKDTSCSSQTFALPESKPWESVHLSRVDQYNPFYRAEQNLSQTKVVFWTWTHSTLKLCLSCMQFDCVGVICYLHLSGGYHTLTRATCDWLVSLTLLSFCLLGSSLLHRDCVASSVRRRLTLTKLSITKYV